MNFLAHFLLCPTGKSADYQLGSLLPDIAKRAGLLLVPQRIGDWHTSEFGEFISGVRLHWTADKAFHNSVLFETGNQLWKKALPDAAMKGVNRKFFLNHLLFEMWLDRLLIQEGPQRPGVMYSRLSEVHVGRLEQFSGKVLNDREGRLVSVFRDFMRRRFIEDYANSQKFAQTAAGIFGHVTRQGGTMALVPAIIEAMKQLGPTEAGVLEMWYQFMSDVRVND